MCLEFFRGLTTNQKDWIRNLNGRWTPTILILFSTLSFICRYIDDPVSCWCPAHFKPAMVDYTNKYCWRKHHIYTNILDDFSKHGLQINVDKRHSWTRWIPLILLFQAISFKIIALMMHFGEVKFGFGEQKLKSLTAGYSMMSLDEREKFGKQLGFYLNQWRKSRILAGLPIGELFITIFVVYVIYLANIITQVVLIDRLLRDPNAKTYGLHLVYNLFGSSSFLWLESPVFMKIFICDFKIRQIANEHHFTVQCVNNINLVLEQMYAFLWVWLFLTAMVSFSGCVVKAFQVLNPRFRKSYVKQYLSSGNILLNNENDVSRFANNILGEDGIMVLKGISEVSSEFLVRDAVINLWILNFGNQSALQQHHQQQHQNMGNSHPVQFQNVLHSSEIEQYPQTTCVPYSLSKDETIPLAHISGKDKTN